ncbi:FANCI solenoid 4-domain-containing protein [Phascolomyces articulosus]|uniref:FANCI solenoid 4-domain-containing protein n=1 Tax=Phascolomyces articulosus TaxID=60185 RepID=A0AAD5K0L2_9FUNG|nr:FANCI solenoid 4-domain-containing protein [Phascolomyces articulosus]
MVKKKVLFLLGINASPLKKKRQIIFRLSKDSESGAKQATQLFNVLLPQVDMLDTNTLYGFAIEITCFIQHQVQIQSRLFELFSKIWNVLSATNSQANDIIDKLLIASWHPASAISIASVFNEMELSTVQLQKVCKRMVKQLAELDVEETPPFIYQLLLLSRKGMKREIITSICHHFIVLKEYATDNVDVPSFRRMEGTVMLHMSFAIKQDQDLGKELIKYVKNDKSHALETFPIACLLSAARIHRLEDMIFDLLRSTVISIYKDNEKLKQCGWISKFSRIDGNRLQQVMMEIVKNSEHGWDQIIQPLTQLAMLLIDFASSQGFAANRPFSASSGMAPPAPIIINNNKQSPMDHVISLGKEILIKIFELHKMVRPEILEQITARIVSHSPSTMHFLDILETIIAQDYFAIEPYIINLRDTLDYLSLLPYATAERLFRAVQPVASRNNQFRDGLMLILRKSMFAKDLNGRMVSVNGFLALLSDVFSQQNNNSSNSSRPSQGVAFEILGLLRRCFNQQSEIRAAAYKGLARLSEHREIASDIFEILYSQFQRVYEKDRGMVTPLRLDVCVDHASHSSGGAPRLAEPIHILLASLFQTLKNLENGMDVTHNSVIADQIHSCREDLTSLVFRLSKSDLEDFELDKTADFDLATHLGQRNNIYAGLMQGTFEAAIEYEYFMRKDTLESYQTILNLFKKRMDAAALLKEGSSVADKGRKSIAMQAEYSVSSLEFLTDVTRRMFSQGNIQRPIRALRGDIGFVHYVILSIPIALKKMTHQIISTMALQERHFQQCIELSKLCIHILKTEDSDSSFVNHPPKKGQHSVLESIWDALKNICETILQLWPNRINTFFSRLTACTMDIVETTTTTDSAPPSPPTNTVIFNVVRLLEEIMNHYLSDRTPLYKEAAKLMQVVAFLSHRMDREATDFKERAGYMTDWLGSMIKERPLDDISLAKQMLHLYIQLCADIQNFTLIVYIAQDLHMIHGDIDHDQNIEEDPSAQVQNMMINIKTCSAITLQLLMFMDQLFDDMMWCIGRLKITASTTGFTDLVREFETSICHRMMSYLSITSEFTKAVLMGQHAEGLIRTLIKTYKTLTALTKYKLMSEPKQISDDFISLIMMSGTGITDKMYQFLIIYGQEHHTTTTTNEPKKKTGSTTTGPNSRKQMVQKAKVLRESKLVPKLIYEVEEFERYLIQLTRKSNKDLMQYMKRSTSRDFKINMSIIHTEQQQQQQEEEDPVTVNKQIAVRNFMKNKGGGHDEDDDGASSGRGSKRARTSR